MGHIISELIIGHSGDKAYFFPKTRHANCDIGRGAAQIFVEIAAFLQRTVQIHRIEIYGDPSKQNQVVFLSLIKCYVLHLYAYLLAPFCRYLSPNQAYAICSICSPIHLHPLPALHPYDLTHSSLASLAPLACLAPTASAIAA